MSMGVRYLWNVVRPRRLNAIVGDVGMTRIAQCSCGSLRVGTTGDPIVVLCHCRECQRRTGAPFGVGAYFKKEQVQSSGNEKIYERGSDSGRKLRMHFCPECGTTVYWEAELRPDHYGVAVGAFAARGSRHRSAQSGRKRAILGSCLTLNCPIFHKVRRPRPWVSPCSGAVGFRLKEMIGPRGLRD